MLLVGAGLVAVMLVLTFATRSRRIRIDLESPSMSPPRTAPPPPLRVEPEPTAAPAPAPGPACPTCRSLMEPSVLYRESAADFNFELDDFEGILEIAPALRAWVLARAPWEPGADEDHVRVDLLACPNCRNGTLTVRHLTPDGEGFEEVVEDRQEIRLAPPVVVALMEDAPSGAQGGSGPGSP